MGGPSAEELLAHKGFVRRVAEGMLSDAHDVDDVVQETYLAALRRPPASGLRAWLGAVARNAARMRLRGARRRVFHGRARLVNVTPAGRTRLTARVREAWAFSRPSSSPSRTAS